MALIAFLRYHSKKSGFSVGGSLTETKELVLSQSQFCEHDPDVLVDRVAPFKGGNERPFSCSQEV